MSFTASSQSGPAKGGLHVPAGTGETTWFSGDTYTIKLATAATGGALSAIEATVPPGGGPPPHVHANSDEMFYLTSGELEFLNQEETFVAGPGDMVFLPRGTRHRFVNVGSQAATMLFFYTPAGPEGLFQEGGQAPVAGQQPQPWTPEQLADPALPALLAKYDNEIRP